MVECEYRISIIKQRVRGITSVAATFHSETVAGAGLRQSFQRGLCKILTARDIGLVECRQPNCSRTNCPDIKG